MATFNFLIGKTPHVYNERGDLIREGVTTHPPVVLHIPTAKQIADIHDRILEQWKPPYVDKEGAHTIPNNVLQEAINEIEDIAQQDMTEDQRVEFDMVISPDEQREYGQKCFRVLGLPALVKAAEAGNAQKESSPASPPKLEVESST